MIVCKRSMFAGAFGGIALALGAASARADFVLVSQNLTLDAKDQKADFNLTFNQAPDFTTLDSQGRQANSFQIDFAGTYPVAGEKFPKDLTAVIRGSEIHFAGVLPIRSTTGAGGPNAGGWGPALNSVPFSLTGDSVSFSVPTQDLGWSGHGYQYHAFSLQFDRLTATQVVTMVPTPTALQGGVAGLMLVAGASAYLRRRARMRAN